MASLGEFSVRIAKRGAQVERNTNRIIKRLALAIDQAVVLETPVDTGRARSNWITSVSTPNRSRIPPYREYSRGSKAEGAGKGEAANAQAAIQQAQTVIAGRQPEQTIYISNNLDYIGILNSQDTPSVQSPPFFVQGAIMAAIAEFRRSRVLE